MITVANKLKNIPLAEGTPIDEMIEYSIVIDEENYKTYLKYDGIISKKAVGRVYKEGISIHKGKLIGILRQNKLISRNKIEQDVFDNFFYEDFRKLDTLELILNNYAYRSILFKSL